MNVKHFTNKAIAEMRRRFKYDPETGKLYNRKTGRELKGKTLEGYLTARFDGTACYVHRLIWCIEYGREPQHVIDHIDRNKQNNRLDNLRDVTMRENTLNRDIKPNKDTGRTGISLDHRGKRFYYHVWLNRKHHYFKTLADAVRFREENGLPL